MKTPCISCVSQGGRWVWLGMGRLSLPCFFSSVPCGLLVLVMFYGLPRRSTRHCTRHCTARALPWEDLLCSSQKPFSHPSPCRFDSLRCWLFFCRSCLLEWPESTRRTTFPDGAPPLTTSSILRTRALWMSREQTGQITSRSEPGRNCRRRQPASE